jgi:hypothetical protein
MKYPFFLFFFFSFLYSQAQGVSEFRIRNLIIDSVVNIHEFPRLNASIIGKMHQGDKIVFVPNGRYVSDTIDGIKSYWLPIKHEGVEGYIWNETNSDNTFFMQNRETLLIKKLDNNRSFRFVIMDDKKNLFDFVQDFSWVNKEQKDYTVYYFQDLKDYPNKSVLYFMYYNKGEKKMEHYTYVLENGKLTFQNNKKLLYNKNIPSGYLVNKWWIIGDKVNIRKEPNLDSEVVVQLNHGDSLESFPKVKIVQDTIAGKSGYWFPVNFNNEKAFVWNHLLEKPLVYFKSIYDEGIAYKITSRNVYLLNKGKVVDTYSYMEKNRFFPERISEVSTPKLKNVDRILKLQYFGEACGKESGDVYIARAGNKLRFLFHNTSMGDGGYGTFSENHLKENILTFSSIEGEDFFSQRVDVFDTYFSYNAKSKQYKWTGEKMVENPGDFDFIYQRAKTNNWVVDNYFKIDVNKDGRKDFVASFRRKLKKVVDWQYTSDDGIIGVYLQNENGKFEVFGENSKILKKGFGAFRASVKDDLVIFEIPYWENCLGCASVKVKDNGYKRYDFEWDSSLNELFLLKTEWLNMKNFKYADDTSYWLIKEYQKEKINYLEAK